jgi:hypothetical protein
MKILYPRLFRPLEKDDLFIGRFDVLPIGFGSTTSLGGVGHYCVFVKLLDFKESLSGEALKARVDKLLAFWADHDTKARYINEYLKDENGNFRDNAHYCWALQNGRDAPVMSCTRVSGMMLNYNKLADKGIRG